MQLSELIGDEPLKGLKGLCDDLFLLMVEFVYRRCTVGWEDEEKKNNALMLLDVKVNDQNTLELFLYWCEMLFDAYDIDFIKVMIEAKSDYLIRECVDFSEIIRIKYLKSLLVMPEFFLLGDVKEKINRILYKSIPLISSNAYDCCLKKMNGCVL